MILLSKSDTVGIVSNYRTWFYSELQLIEISPTISKYMIPQVLYCTNMNEISGPHT